MVRRVRRDSWIASATAAICGRSSTMSADCIAISVPPPIAMPRSAAASAAASLTPSPTIATTCPSRWRPSTTAYFSCGRTPEMTREGAMPTSWATRAALVALSPVSR